MYFALEYFFFFRLAGPSYPSIQMLPMVTQWRNFQSKDPWNCVRYSSLFLFTVWEVWFSFSKHDKIHFSCYRGLGETKFLAVCVYFLLWLESWNFTIKNFLVASFFYLYFLVENFILFSRKHDIIHLIVMEDWETQISGCVFFLWLVIWNLSHSLFNKSFLEASF